jgi:hypothetical protein
VSFVGEVPSAKTDSDYISQRGDAALKGGSTNDWAKGDAGLKARSTVKMRADYAELKLGSTRRTVS